MKKISFESILNVLKKEPYFLESFYLMCDFDKGQILSINKVFPNRLLNCCFFHFLQIMWMKFKKYKMRGKWTYDCIYSLLFNIQLLCFIKPI